MTKDEFNKLIDEIFPVQFKILQIHVTGRVLTGNTAPESLTLPYEIYRIGLKKLFSEAMDGVIAEDEPLKQPDKVIEDVMGAPQVFLNVDVVARNQLRQEQHKRKEELLE